MNVVVWSEQSLFTTNVVCVGIDEQSNSSHWFLMSNTFRERNLEITFASKCTRLHILQSRSSYLLFSQISYRVGFTCRHTICISLHWHTWQISIWQFVKLSNKLIQTNNLNNSMVTVVSTGFSTSYWPGLSFVSRRGWILVVTSSNPFVRFITIPSLLQHNHLTFHSLSDVLNICRKSDNVWR